MVPVAAFSVPQLAKGGGGVTKFHHDSQKRARQGEWTDNMNPLSVRLDTKSRLALRLVT